MPEGDLYSEIQKTTDRLAKKYHTPQFKPHVSIIGRVYDEDTMAKTEKLASMLKPTQITISGLDYSDIWTRSLFFKVAGAEKAIELAKQIFNRNDDHFGHMSLLYGEIPDSEKKKIMQELVNTKFTFTADKIFVMTESRQPRDWKYIREFDL